MPERYSNRSSAAVLLLVSRRLTVHYLAVRAVFLTPRLDAPRAERPKAMKLVLVAAQWKRQRHRYDH